jgi:hypothetical protein
LHRPFFSDSILHPVYHPLIPLSTILTLIFPLSPFVPTPQARHLSLVVKAFEALGGAAERAVCFGSYRVELLVALFHRVVDLHNFEVGTVGSATG